ncbi:putative alpha-xylosidase [Fusarium avenaceum]|nr:putative alpha-xylosidase [Fusarium avenaceum]
MLNYNFRTDPIPDVDALVSGPNYRFTIINDLVLRFEWAEDGIFEDRSSTFAINRRLTRQNKHTVKETDTHLEIITPTIHVSYDKKRFSPSGLKIEATHQTNMWETTWRYGETSAFNLGGTARTLDGIDGRCDVGPGVLSRAGFSFIDDSDSMLFDEGFVSPRCQGDRTDGYFFSFGSNFKGAMKAYFDISGHTPIIPRWALGNWWSRFHKYTGQEYIDLMDRFKRNGIPLSVAVLDMDWHVVDEAPHSGWTGYTWNKKLFPDPENFAEDLHKRNLKITLNDHPHAGIASHEEQYEAIAKFLDHGTSEKTPILFDPTDVKFMEAFFDILHRGLEKKGCDFWWIDWQQGSHSAIPGLDPLWLLNHYHYLDQQQTVGEKQALIFSRYAGPGSHRYPIGFSGDTIVTWDSFRFQPEFTATASNIGYGWWSHDVGGHMFGSRDDELVARWVQLGVFSPIMRLHSCDTPWGSKEPWNYRHDAQQAITFFMQLRHRLIPYLYTLNVNFSKNDEPLVQPLYWKFPVTKQAFEYPNVYFFGPSLLVAPITEPASVTTQHAPVKAWLPPLAARYIDIMTGTVYDGDRELQLWRRLSHIPLLAPEGAIIPLDAAHIPVNGGKNPTSLEIIVIVGQDGEFVMVEDPSDDESNGHGEARFVQIAWSQVSGQLSIDNLNGQDWSLRFLGLSRPENAQVRVGGLPIENAEFQDTSDRGLAAGFVVKLPRSASRGQAIIYVGEDPQLNVNDYKERLRGLLLDFQIQFALKDKLFAIIEGEQPAVVKVANLLNVTSDMNILGPLIDLLTADSRK